MLSEIYSHHQIHWTVLEGWGALNIHPNNIGDSQMNTIDPTHSSVGIHTKKSVLGCYWGKLHIGRHVFHRKFLTQKVGLRIHHPRFVRDFPHWSLKSGTYDLDSQRLGSARRVPLDPRVLLVDCNNVRGKGCERRFDPGRKSCSLWGKLTWYLFHVFFWFSLHMSCHKIINGVVFTATFSFHLDFRWGFHVVPWHAFCLLAMLALLLSQDVLEKCCSTFWKRSK